MLTKPAETIPAGLHYTRPWSGPTLGALTGTFRAGRTGSGHNANLQLWTSGYSVSTVITGPIGTGKTRLLELYAAEAHHSPQCAPAWICDPSAGLAAWRCYADQYGWTLDGCMLILRAAAAVIADRRRQFIAHRRRRVDAVPVVPVLPVLVDDSDLLTGERAYGKEAAKLIAYGLLNGRSVDVPFIVTRLHSAGSALAAEHVRMISRHTQFPGVACATGSDDMFRADLITDLDAALSNTPAGDLDEESAGAAAKVLENA